MWLDRVSNEEVLKELEKRETYWKVLKMESTY